MLKLSFHFHFKINRGSFYSTRVRFAPSPTGHLHVGGLKTALMNYLFSKSSFGKFIFRLEDTDRIRYDHSSVDNIIKSLNWFGIDFDEGIKSGKPVYEYCQSNRLSYYHNAVDKLIAEGKAYHCFCSQQRLDFIKKEQHRLGDKSGYDRKCAHLTAKQISANLQQGMDNVVRLRVADEWCDVDFVDLVFGQVSIPSSNVDIDPILLKTDRFPVYHLANVVDDHLMGITHVIRGQEWISSTPKHILLYRAFGWFPPEFAHLPLIMKEGGLKVSKRDANFNESHYNIEYLIDKGYSPSVIISWLMSCGSGMTCEWHPNISLQEIIDNFSLLAVSTHNAALSKSLLEVVGRSQLSSMTLTRSYFNDIVSPYMTRHNVRMSYEQFQKYFHILRHRCTCLHDLIQFSYLWSVNDVTIEDLASLIKTDNVKGVDAVKELLERFHEWVQSNQLGSIESIYSGICSKASAMKCLRKLLTNKLDGPKISELLELFTKDEIIRKISHTLK